MPRSNRAFLPMLLLACTPALAASSDERFRDQLLALSLEDLGNVEVTSVSRRGQRSAQAPASVFVISRDDIRRSGATSLPEALRLAPNLQVARVSTHAYAISARGFNNAIGNKMQVIQDGRVLYSPLFTGVFWDTQDTALEEIERIEVISGPAAAMWGANAVNGIINIVTRPASESAGGTAAVMAGTDEQILSARLGGSSGGAHWRLFARHADREASERINGSPGRDSIWRSHVGFRSDWGDADDGLTLQGDVYRGAFQSFLPVPTRIEGGNLLARWSRVGANGDRLQVLGYYDHSRREIATGLTDDLGTWNLEFQHGTSRFTGHELIWGAGMQSLDDEVTNGRTQAFFPEDRTLHNSWLFLQDEFAPTESIRILGGVRAARNSYTGTELLPTLRLSWYSTPDSMLWAGVSRAVRAPSRLDRELFQPQTPPFTLVGNDDFLSEVAVVTELGWRAAPSPRTSYSLTVFNQEYDRLRSVERIGTGPFFFDNKLHGRSRGLEAWGLVQLREDWRLSAGALLLDVDLRIRPGSTETTTSRLANDPRQQLQLRSSFDISPNLLFDVMVRHVGALPAPAVDAYTTFDVRLAWRPSNSLELAAVGRNLGQSRHVEFPSATLANEMERTLMATVRWWW